MRRVAVSGPPSTIANRLIDLLEADREVGRVVVVRAAPQESRDLKTVLEGCDTLLHLPGPPGSVADDDWSDQPDVTRRVLDAGGAVGVVTVVCLSSALVYGAWPDNPLPLTEDAPARPRSTLLAARALAEIERVLAEWRAEHPSTTVAILRPVTIVDPDQPGAGLAPWTAPVARVRGSLPPVQFVHRNDVLEALLLAVRHSLNGAFNVAPDGWVPGEDARALSGALLRLPLPERVARLVWSAAASLGLSSMPAGFVPYLVHPWVVANDRVRAAGWEPRQSNEEAFVSGHRLPRWREKLGRHRQHAALTVAGGLLGVIGFGLARFLRRRDSS